MVVLLGVWFFFFSAPAVASDKIVMIDELKALIAEKPKGTLELFDVREPYEYAGGFIPTATNLPCSSSCHHHHHHHHHHPPHHPHHRPVCASRSDSFLNQVVVTDLSPLLL
jgi:ABC-type nickel/cobalt efflux system permease component RcnA